MPGVYREFVENVARFVDEERKDAKDAERAAGASTARDFMAAAKASERDAASKELNRLRAIGMISEAEFKRRHAQLTGD